MNKKVTIGNLELGHTPAIAVVIDRKFPIETVKQLKKNGASLCEIRFDLFNEPWEDILGYISNIRKYCGLPFIGTIRANNWTNSNRLKLFEQIFPLVDAVDIEVDAEIQRDVVTIYKDKTVIISEHDYVSTPSIERLVSVTETSIKAGADIVKWAVTPQNKEEIIRMLKFCHEHPAPIVAISMGKFGAISRVIAPLFGSLFTFSFIAEAVAPGQIPLAELSQTISGLYPEI